ncbi:MULTISPECIES: hypothetical protein [unclassified Streptomyces]|uniref:hypothetical protein n=1 Tax=unclassified Streptomyces TaxID=2593676 RepID=UPI002E27D864|nr:hypothetical protein [Streptomyces sp. NBC_00228]
MRRTSYTLSVLYALLAVGLFRCALVSHERGSVGYTAFFAAASIGAALAIVHVSWLHDEYRDVLAELDRRRPPIRIVSLEDQKAADRAADCCELWWTTAGAEHDPATCTRKDTTA